MRIVAAVFAYFALGFIMIAFDNGVEQSSNKRLAMFWIGAVCAAAAGWLAGIK